MEIEITKEYLFTWHGGGKIIDGKAHWPVYLRVHVPKFHAWNLIYTMLRQIESNETTIVFSAMGEMLEDRGE